MISSERTVSRAVIYNREAKLLFAKRARGIGRDQWAFIGGKPDAGETEKDAAMMENLEITTLQQLGFNNPYEEI